MVDGPLAGLSANDVVRKLRRAGFVFHWQAISDLDLMYIEPLKSVELPQAARRLFQLHLCY